MFTQLCRIYKLKFKESKNKTTACNVETFAYFILCDMFVVYLKVKKDVYIMLYLFCIPNELIPRGFILNQTRFSSFNNTCVCGRIKNIMLIFLFIVK